MKPLKSEQQNPNLIPTELYLSADGDRVYERYTVFQNNRIYEVTETVIDGTLNIWVKEVK